MKASVIVASGSRETDTFSAGESARISHAIETRKLCVVDVIRALAKRGFVPEAENLLKLVKLRVSGDYLQTSAIVRDERVISAINDPNDYAGPGTGYRLTETRRDEIIGIRDTLGQSEVLSAQARHKKAETNRIAYRSAGIAGQGTDITEVVIAISPAFGVQLFQTTGGHDLSAVLRCLIDGIKSSGCSARVARMHHTADTSFLGLSAAKISGSGIGIQAKGTAIIHSSDRLPHNNLELFSNAPITTLDHYRSLGANAGLYALKKEVEPILVPTQGEALGARYHAQVALTQAIETGLVDPNRGPDQLIPKFFDNTRGAK
jgi:propanediol dehydratase large subunit